MLPSALLLLCLGAVGVRSRDDTTTSSSSATSKSTSTSSSTQTSSRTSTTSGDDGLLYTNLLSTITTDIPTSAFTGSEYVYVKVTGQSTVITSSSTSNDTSTTSISSNSQITVSAKSVSLTVIGGVTTTSASNGTSTGTSSAAAATNTVPCNGWTEFCNRKYSNITFVTAHNAAFVVKDNAASNQALGITDQLDDGIRMIQGEVHWVNDTLYNCHTSCDLLNAGTYQSTLETIRSWLEDNPYDVLTILIVNSDFTDVENFVPAFTNAGLLPYAYRPAYIPQYRDQWPTLAEMILTNKRLVIFMDYDADQTKVPYILDEFTHMWETPYSPVNQAFPCTTQRPPNLNQTVARDELMNLANHNLNVAVDLSSLGISTTLLIPDTAELNLTNGQGEDYGTLGLMSTNCTAEWGKPPNFLLVDYYNYGSPEQGSVFHVAAAANGVKYTESCCGEESTAPLTRASFFGLEVAMIVAVLLW